MTLGTHSQYSPPLAMPEARDARAVSLGKLIKEKRLDLGLNRPAFVREMARHGEEITPDYLNKLESGAASLARASLEVREGIRIVLGFSLEAWHHSTGLYTGAETPAPVQAVQPRLRELPAALAQMVEEKKHLDSMLTEPRWQQYLAGQRFSTGTATPDRYWNLFLLLKNAGVEPSGN